MGKIQIPAYKCERCGHIWIPRKKQEEPKVCPKCKSPYWNKPRKKVKSSKGKEGSRRSVSHAEN